jgi:ubiquinone/menaquinone biosynthesis C-methylase UbiE
MLHKAHRTKVYDKRASSYEFGMSTLRYFKTVQLFLRSMQLSLPPSPKILDLGCGTGAFTEMFLRKFQDANITGFDFSENMLKIYQDRFPAHPIIQGNYNDESSFRRFPAMDPCHIKEQTFDLVYSFCSVTEYGNYQQILPMIYKMLKPGGIFLSIGIHANLIGYISGLYWHFTPCSESDYFNHVQQAGFLAQKLEVPWKLFPMNIMKYVILARK